DQDSLKKEANALRAFQNYSAIKVLAEGDGFLLLQRAIPGQSLRILFPDLDSKALKITANLIGQLHRAAYSSDDFTHLRDWLEPLRCTWDIPEGFLSLANSLATDLLHSSKSQVLLHADLHHDNILQNGAEWVVIDPKGVIGDPVYEVAAFIRNPIDCLINTADLESILLERSTAFAKLLNFERTRILQWSFVQAVLSWVWAIEDDTDITYFEKLTHTLDRVLQKD
ncbi:MAG: streptomycin phosphotransferase, partial [Gammaproteobacteria bacterium]|nr:streptomycin phosphotransferase [Gammaproteobacteria bacterium]